MKIAHLASMALLAGTTAAMGQNYLVLAADSATNGNDVATALMAQGLTNVTVLAGTSLPTPTLNELLAYDAVITWSNQSYADGAAMGDVLADYVDAGGGVVVAVYAVSTTTANRSLTGRWETGGYEIIPARSGNTTAAAVLGTVHLPAHPLWDSIVDFTGDPTPARAVTTDMAAHGVRVADWDTGQVLAATSTQFPNRVDINIFPGEYDAYAGGARLMANALLVADAGASPAPGSCCFTDGTCQVVLPGACATQGGNFRGPGTDCTVACPQPAACCFPSGACAVMREADCIAQGGTFNSAAPDCVTANCPQPPTGGCCLPDNTCIIEWQGGCLAAGGIYGGDNTTCATANCANVVVPNSTATVEGNSSNSIPFTTTVDHYRYQQVYSASEFSALSGPHRITAVRFRPNATSTATPWENSFTLNMSMSTTTAAPDALSTTFADNIGLDATVVYSGPATISTMQTTPISPGPALFDVIITFQTPFEYNPANGNLLMDLTKDGDTIPASRFLDAESPTGDGVSRLYSSTVGATTGTASSIGLVTQFLVEPVTGTTCYANCDGSTTQPILNVADFTCFLQRFAAGESYANCDNSTTPPVLNVADFTCFLQSFAAGCP